MSYLVQVNTLHKNILENNYKGLNLIALPLFSPTELLCQRGLGNSSMSESPFFTFVIQLNVMGKMWLTAVLGDIFTIRLRNCVTPNVHFDALCQAELNSLIISVSKPQYFRNKVVEI